MLQHFLCSHDMHENNAKKKCNKVDAYIQNHFALLKEATASANKTKNERKKKKNRDVMTAGHLECCFCNAYSTLLW